VTPDNGAYMVAAYVVTAVVVLFYSASLLLKTRAVKKKFKE